MEVPILREVQQRKQDIAEYLMSDIAHFLASWFGGAQTATPQSQVP